MEGVIISEGAEIEEEDQDLTRIETHVRFVGTLIIQQHGAIIGMMKGLWDLDHLRTLPHLNINLLL